MNKVADNFSAPQPWIHIELSHKHKLSKWIEFPRLIHEVIINDRLEAILGVPLDEDHPN